MSARRSARLGAAFLMATSAIGPGFLTQTALFTSQLGASFGFAILASILLDVGAQLNIWRIIAVSERRAQDVANIVLPGLGHALAVAVAIGGLASESGRDPWDVFLDYARKLTKNPGTPDVRRDTRSRTSLAAASMSRSRVNWTVICVEPRVLVEVIESMPGMVENCFSRGVATAEAMVSGLAPGSEAVTWIVGKSTLGIAATGRSR